jgi:alkanesulfonate monooxygenase SsuD/methylene tetrahydromethanopterin reductase-like flavin-dependent oxidoreductase (luciferase family)
MPLQKPRPPILVGGASDAALRRAARLGDGWHASGMAPSAFRASALAVANHWKDAGREGGPELTLRVPLLLDGIHRPAVDPALLGTRHVVRGPIASVAKELRQYQTAGCSHVALELSYSTYPAILDTIDILAEEIRPLLDQRDR